MDISDDFEDSDRLDYIQAMLTSLRKLLGKAGSPFLIYFLDMAAAQAKYEAQWAQMKSGAPHLDVQFLPGYWDGVDRKKH